MTKFFSSTLPIAIGMLLSTISVFLTINIIWNCAHAKQLPPIHCGMFDIGTAYGALSVFSARYIWVTAALALCGALLKGPLRRWIMCFLIPIGIVMLGTYLGVNVFELDCRRNVYGNENGLCY